MDPMKELERRVGKGSQAAIAREIGVTPQFISLIMKRQRPLSPKVLEYLGIREVKRFHRIS